MISPTEDNFETEVFSAGVNVFFKPTRSYYTFVRLSDDKYISPSAPLSRGAHVRHAGPSGDTGEYDPAEVLEFAYQLASKAAKP